MPMVASAASRGKASAAFTPQETRQNSHFEMTSPLNRLRNLAAAERLKLAGSSLHPPDEVNQRIQGAAATMYGGEDEDDDGGRGGGSGGGSGGSGSIKPRRLGDQSKSLSISGKVASWCVDDLDDLGLDAQPNGVSASGSVNRAERALRLSRDRPSPLSGVSPGAASAHIRGGGGAARKGVSFSGREVSGASSAPGSSVADDASTEDNGDGMVGGSFIGALPGAKSLRGVSAFVSPGDSRSVAAHYEPRSKIGERGSGVGPFMVSMQVRWRGPRVGLLVRVFSHSWMRVPAVH